ILIKENHISAAGGIQEALAQAGRFPYPVQIEVETLSQMEEALRHGAQSILLDNFTLQQLHDAVRLNQHQAILEASGGVNLDTVRQIALTGVDRISVGQLTKDIGAIDLSMRLETSQADSAFFDISPYSKG
ncbi:MAG: hypothetical protein KGL58_02135, partial [Pseudomonadota bacterium]|nr:hypothetical protein [Pseudomonadota bacterium]